MAYTDLLLWYTGGFFMRLEAAKKDYLTEIEIRKYSPKTVRAYNNNLDLFLRFCKDQAGVDDIEMLTPVVVRQFTKFMVDKGREGTYINRLLKSIKSFIQYCYDEEMGGFNTKNSFRWVKEEKPIIQTFRPEHVRAMLNDCRGRDFLSVRDRAILTMLFETGIRCWELCCLKPEDIDLDVSPMIDLTDDEKIDVVAARILKKYKTAFMELAK